MFTIRFVLVVIAASMLTADVTGENIDRIGTIMTMISELARNVANITGHVTKIESTMKDVSSRETVMETKMEEIEKKIDAASSQSKKIEKKIDAASSQSKKIEKKIQSIEASRNRYPYGWKFLGRGQHVSCDDYLEKGPISFTECVNFCEKKRINDGASWNGFNYYTNVQFCSCHKNDRGHNSSPTDGVHFRFE